MKLEGIHHITAITGDAAGNVDFYAGVLGLRMVKQTVNQDDPTVYHLFYGDDDGSPGMDLTFFEYPGAARGQRRARAWSTGSSGASARRRRSSSGRSASKSAASRSKPAPTAACCSQIPRASRTSCSSADVPDPPLRASAPAIPPEHALQGFDGVRAYTRRPGAQRRSAAARRWASRPRTASAGRCAASERGSFYAYDAAPPEAVASQGAGTVHHIAFASTAADEEAWRARVAESGAHPTPIIDRFYFRSVYFREPSGVLFEIATIGPGFAVDEDAAHLGERLSLPPRFEPLRERLRGHAHAAAVSAPAGGLASGRPAGLGRGLGLPRARRAGSAAGGADAVAAIRRAPRPCVRKLNAQRVSTISRF